jgi:hypothetical protein
MDVLPTLRASHTHLFPGAILIPDDSAASSAGDVPVVVEFSDGAIAEAALYEVLGDGLGLAVEEYRTGAGTDIEAKQWGLKPFKDGAFKVAHGA